MSASGVVRDDSYDMVCPFWGDISVVGFHWVMERLSCASYDMWARGATAMRKMHRCISSNLQWVPSVCVIHMSWPVYASELHHRGCANELLRSRIVHVSANLIRIGSCRQGD